MKRPDSMSYERYREVLKKKKRLQKIKLAGVFASGPAKGRSVFLVLEARRKRVRALELAMMQMQAQQSRA